MLPARVAGSLKDPSLAPELQKLSEEWIAFPKKVGA
jgi:hypothetical protein